MEMNEQQYIGFVIEHEGLTMEEAVLTYKRRKKLPAKAFCGPNRSYPVHDAAHVRNALARLSQHGGKFSPAVRARILGCIKRRAKRFGVEVSESVEGRLCLAKWDEDIPEKERKELLQSIEETVSWFTDRVKD